MAGSRLSFDNLPEPTVDTILSFLPFNDVVAVGCVNSACRASSLRPVLWHSLYLRDFSSWRSPSAKPDVPLPRPSSTVCAVDNDVPQRSPAYYAASDQHRRLYGHLLLYDASELKFARVSYWSTQRTMRMAAAVEDVRREQERLLLRALPRMIKARQLHHVACSFVPTAFFPFCLMVTPALACTRGNVQNDVVPVAWVLAPMLLYSLWLLAASLVYLCVRRAYYRQRAQTTARQRLINPMVSMYTLNSLIVGILVAFAEPVCRRSRTVKTFDDVGSPYWLSFALSLLLLSVGLPFLVSVGLFSGWLMALVPTYFFVAFLTVVAFTIQRTTVARPAVLCALCVLYPLLAFAVMSACNADGVCSIKPSFLALPGHASAVCLTAVLVMFAAQSRRRQRCRNALLSIGAFLIAVAPLEAGVVVMHLVAEGYGIESGYRGAMAPLCIGALALALLPALRMGYFIQRNHYVSSSTFKPHPPARSFVHQRVALPTAVQQLVDAAGAAHQQRFLITHHPTAPKVYMAPRFRAALLHA